MPQGSGALHGVAALLLAAVLSYAPAPARAAECAEYYSIDLNLLIDYSASMSDPPWKHELARAFALEVIETLVAVGRLERAGGIGFPTDASHGFDLVVTEANVAPLRDQIASARTSDGYGSPIYNAAIVGSNHLAALSDPNRRILVLLTDGEDTTGTSRGEAITALRGSGAWNYLVFVGEEMDTPATVLRDLARDSGSQFDRAGPGALDTLVRRVLEHACRNHRPTVSLRITPAGARELGVPATGGGLAEPGFDALFDASASRDVETPSSDLEFRWTLSGPDLDAPGGRREESFSGRGASGHSLRHSFSDRQIGTWQVTLRVDDGAGSVATVTESYAVRGAPPAYDLEGGGQVEAGDELVVSTTILHDTDNRPSEERGRLSFDWSVAAGPGGGSHRHGTAPCWDGGEARCWDTPEVRWRTGGEDVTMLSDRTRVGDAWELHLTVRDNEGLMEGPVPVVVEVINRPPSIRLEAAEALVVGEELAVRAEVDDPDGGELGSLTWEIVQAPDADADGATLRAGPLEETSTDWGFTTDLRDAGTWIVRLTAVDDEGEEAIAERTILVDAPVEIEIAAPAASIGSLTEALTLSGAGSVDPDSPCQHGSCPCEPTEDRCHTNIDGPVQAISPGIVRWTWTLVDVPIEYVSRFPLGGLAEALDVDGHAAEVHLDPHTLPPGEWTFQLELEDGEGNAADARVQVAVTDESGDPVAVITEPRTYVLSPGGEAPADVAVSGAASFDPDTLLAGIAHPRRGIEEYLWEIVERPPLSAGLCEPASTEADFTLFRARTIVPPECRGSWRIRLTVIDDDEPVARQDSVETLVQATTCLEPICIIAPTTARPAVIGRGEPIDVPIYFHLEHSLFAGRALATVLAIFDREDPTTPVFTAFEPNLVATPAGAMLAFHWTGHRGLRPPRTGVYDVRISLVDPLSSTPMTTASEPAAIWIEVDPQTRVEVLAGTELPADHIDVARWDEAYGAGPAYVVRNGRTDNFIDRDPARFYVEVNDPAADVDPERRDRVVVQVATVEADGTVRDDPTDVELEEQADSAGRFATGRFRSPAQLAVMASDLPFGDPDDSYRAHSGTSRGPAGDEERGDRTHQAGIDDSFVVSYRPRPGQPTMTRRVPVCERSPDARRKVIVDFLVFNEPFLDVGFDHDGDPATPEVNPQVGEFDYHDANGNDRHDEGERSEPFMETPDSDLAPWLFRSGVGSWGPLVASTFDAHIALANAMWSPACLAFERGVVEYEDLPRVPGPIPQYGGEPLGVDAGEEADSIFASYARADPTRLRVFVVPQLEGAVGVAYSADVVESLRGSPLFGPAIFLQSFVRESTFSHELGHVLTNTDDPDEPTPAPWFYPQWRPFAPGVTRVNFLRRFPLATELDARTDRSQSHAVPGDLTSPPPAPEAPGSYLLRPYVP